MKLTEDAGSTIDSNILLKDNWQINLCGKEYQDVSLDNFSFPCTQKGDRIEMCCELPYKYDIASIGFYSIHSRFTVTFDGKLIYTYGYEDLSEKKIIGYGTHLIKLPKEYEGKTLAISLEVTENNAFTTLECPRLCNPFTYDRSVIFKNRIPFTVNIFLVLFGLITSLVAVSMVSVNKKIFQLFYLGMFSLCVGLWTLANHNLFFVFSYDLLVKTLVEYGTLYLACLFFFALFQKSVLCRFEVPENYLLQSAFSLYIISDSGIWRSDFEFSSFPGIAVFLSYSSRDGYDICDICNYFRYKKKKDRIQSSVLGTCYYVLFLFIRCCSFLLYKIFKSFVVL